MRPPSSEIFKASILSDCLDTARYRDQAKLFEQMKDNAWQSLRRFTPREIARYWAWQRMDAVLAVVGSAQGAVRPHDDPDPARRVARRILQRLDWTVVRRLDGLLQGDYRSLFYGYGIDFADLREYQPEDDVRYIDWNVTARMNTPHIRQYVEERDITAWFLLDLSPSVDFGTSERLAQKRLPRVLFECIGSGVEDEQGPALPEGLGFRPHHQPLPGHVLLFQHSVQNHRQ